MDYNYKRYQDNVLREKERSNAEAKQRELDKKLNEVNQIEYSHSVSRDRPLPFDRWRPAWTTTQVVYIMNVMFLHNKILSGTLDKMYNKWDDSKSFIEDTLNVEVSSKNYLNDEDLNTLKGYLQSDKYPYYEKPEMFFNKTGASFPFKDRLRKHDSDVEEKKSKKMGGPK